MQFLSQDLPFKRIATLEVPDANMTPAADLRALEVQSEHEFFATVYDELIQFSSESGPWFIKNRAPINSTNVKSCSVLSNASILVAMFDKFSFYSLGLAHTADVSLKDTVE